MKKKRVLLTILLCIIGLSVIVASVARISYVNNLFPNPSINTYTTGEIIKGGDISICVNKSKLYSGNEFEKKYDYSPMTMNDDGSVMNGEQYKVLLVDINVINNTMEPQTMSLVQFYAETLTWSNGLDAGIYGMVNQNKNASMDPQNFELKPNQSSSVTLPYSMYYFQFQTNDWSVLSLRDIDLSLSWYPVKNIVQLI